MAFEQVKERLEKERLFDEEFKRPLPYFPRRIGVVTSPNGAAFHDILNVVTRRTRSVSIVLVPARVQGETAPEEIRSAIQLANDFNRQRGAEDKIDVLIVGRGGGAAEDLAAFNEERLARTIFSSEIPVISAVGHEIDLTIADLVADVRAPTPSAAAEIVAAREDDVKAIVEQRTADLRQLIDYRLVRTRARVVELARSPAFHELPQGVADLKLGLGKVKKRLDRVAVVGLRSNTNAFRGISKRLNPVRLASNLGDKKARLAVLNERVRSSTGKSISARSDSLRISLAALEALSPLSVLERGFSLTQLDTGEIVRDSSQLEKDNEVKIRFAKGRIKARVTDKE